MAPILALWATPRSTSTPFEWMMRERGDFTVLHEPFNEVYHYGEDRLSERDGDVASKPGLTFASVCAALEEQAAQGPLFIKDFVYSVDHMIDEGFLARFTHSFLIRDPARSLPSLYAHWPDFTAAEAGYESLHRLFERIAERDGTPPPVIDSDDFLDAPHAIVEAYCSAVGIPYKPEALSWNAGGRQEVSWYDGGSWHGNLRQSTGVTRQKRDYVPIDHDDHLKRAYEACRPLYDALHAHRLRAPQEAAP
jgi:hypothetical protein